MKRRLRHQGGQVVLEYVLLIVVSVGLATFITSQMVSRNPDSPGFLIGKWMQMLRFVGDDQASKVGTGQQP